MTTQQFPTPPRPPAPRPPAFPSGRLYALIGITMLAFAANSLLNRVALTTTNIDAASFTAIRLLSGGVMLWMLTRVKYGKEALRGDWYSALALFGYAGGFSFAYLSLPAATGALLLFAAVQITMLGYGLWTGERFQRLQWVGFTLAVLGLVVLLSPGLSAPSWTGAGLMLMAGIAWGVYSLRGKGVGAPLLVTTGNFIRSVPLAVLLVVVTSTSVTIDVVGVAYAVLSGALASGLGYALWYQLLPAIQATTAATVQLSVPVFAAVGGVLLLGEPLSLRLLLSSLAILGGIALVLRAPGKPRPD
ncbi:DMT family transporter [Photobacterium sp. TY1-4]|uniref:DMT family transporter n=1 Tax=Photobacterium sp. TY1-4 TaxID=2899122 RepID=UPI0021C043D8|nr:DMT family transporter [Photobacterium sp. TY1-4]UXI03848.1 DMT family transporter [Photobacterium sp. TY1-4]